MTALPPIHHAACHHISYRPMTQGDMQFLAELYRSTREAEMARTSWSEAEKKAFAEMQFQAQHSHYQKHYPKALWLVIEQNDQPVGRLYLERWSKEHRIIDIALRPSARGLGLGTALLRDIMDEAAADGKSTSIHVEKENPALSLYHRLGFHSIEDKGVYELLEWRPDPLPQSTATVR